MQEKIDAVAEEICHLKKEKKLLLLSAARNEEEEKNKADLLQKIEAVQNEIKEAKEVNLVLERQVRIFGQLRLLENRIDRLYSAKYPKDNSGLAQQQLRILSNLEDLSKRVDKLSGTTEDLHSLAAVQRVMRGCADFGLKSAKLFTVASDYYDWPFEQRIEALQGESIHQLCKTIIVENSKCINNDCRDPNNSKYYAVILQYTTKYQSQKLQAFVRGQNRGIGKRKFKMRMTSKDEAAALSGFEFNATSPFGTTATPPIPIILSENILKLQPPQIYLGAGHPDVKVRLSVAELAKNPNIVVLNCTYDDIVITDPHS
eukprot:TRINITY_DN7262_c0_g1_i1.p1 TRINITY_DN7262_c0_g1~~TRINITY_DN7262_c0_g1_i1.p1  ORF type:complete len:316 (+),score=62.09 TRINITY_DN7262_c0_g1_i1:633-1580(+)